MFGLAAGAAAFTGAFASAFTGAFVAAGFEHSIANMYFFPLAMLLQADGVGASVPAVTVAGFAGNLLPVILGNIAGGSVLVGLVYHLIYGKPAGRVQR